MPFLYILRCADNALYIGETDNLEARLAPRAKKEALIAGVLDGLKRL